MRVPLAYVLELLECLLSRTRELCLRIRRGDADDGGWRDALIAHLRQTVADKLAVSKPPRAR